MKTPHPQADVLRAIADGEEIEVFFKEEWLWCRPERALLHASTQEFNLRVKPRTININGFEVPEPLRTAPGDGVVVWILYLTREGGVLKTQGHDRDALAFWLKAGICHLTQEAAELHAKALLSFTKES